MKNKIKNIVLYIKDLYKCIYVVLKSPIHIKDAVSFVTRVGHLLYGENLPQKTLDEVLKDIEALRDYKINTLYGLESDN